MFKSTHFSVVLLLVVAGMLITGCKNSSDNSARKNGVVTTDICNAADSTTIQLSNGTTCKTHVELIIEYPQKIKGSSGIKTLQQLFVSNVLEMDNAENLPIKQLAKRYTENYFGADSNTESNETMISGDDVRVDNVDVKIVVKVVYDDNGLLSVCREEKMSKNGRPASTTHHYYNFTTGDTICSLGVQDLIAVESLPDVCSMLKNRLLEMNDADNEDQLSDLGYYNLPNMSVTNNFYFTSESVAWCYLPNEIAVFAVGETVVELPRSALQPFAAPNAIVNL